jgi:hypothetical protein
VNLIKPKRTSAKNGAKHIRWLLEGPEAFLMIKRTPIIVKLSINAPAMAFICANRLKPVVKVSRNAVPEPKR